MSFNITSEIEEDLNLLQIVDLKTGIRIRILPEAGALLHEFSIPIDNRRVQVVDGYKNQADLKKNYPVSYKSAKLSPFVCRIAEGRYQFEGTDYEFRNKFPDGTAIHGILFNRPFSILEKKIEKDRASVKLGYHYQQEDPAYPFEYRITVNYALKTGGRLSLETTVQNCSGTAIPMADGWHPYFKLEGRVDDWLLYFRSRKNVAFDEKLIPTGHFIDTDAFYTPHLVGETFFDHCYKLEPDDGLAAATLENPVNGLRLSIFPEPSYPYLQIYTPPHRESIAIENLSSAPDSFNNGMGLIIMKPGDLQSFGVVYQLDLL